MSGIVKYLIAVNFLAFIIYTIDFQIYKNGGKGVPGPITNISTIIGGSLGTLVAYIIWDRKINKINIQSRVYTIIWLLLHIILLIVFFGPNSEKNIALITRIYNEHKILFIYLLLINIVTFIVFAVDKIKAMNNAWRIREIILLGMSLLGGSLGALLAMDICNHKINKMYFMVGVPLMICIHIVLISCLVMGIL